MRQYEVTFIIDPVLSSDEISSTAKMYADMLKENKCEIVHVEETGLRQLAYPINKRTSGVYFCVEFQADNYEIIERIELALRRDERIMRFLTVALDKYGIKYNDDKRNGLIGKSKKAELSAEIKAEVKAEAKAAAKPEPAKAEPVKAEPVKAETATAEPVVAAAVVADSTQEEE